MGKTDQEIRQEIVSEVERAFAGVQLGKGTTLHQACAIHDNKSVSQQAEARQRDVGTRWQDVPDALIEEHSCDIYCLDPEGFRYYIPAFMVCALRCPDVRASAAADMALSSLGLGPLDRCALKRFKLFTAPQAVAIAHFLRYFEMGPYHEDLTREGRAKYWKKFA